MRNIFKTRLVSIIGIIALAAVIGFLMTACGGGKTINSATELKEYLDKQPANSPDKPIKIKMSVNDNTLADITRTINSAGKYVSLDLSKSSGLTDIKRVFEENKLLVGISLPSSVTSIGSMAFDGCTSLASVTIPNSVTSIGERAFASSSITSITIPDSVTSIGERAFESSKITSITIPKSVTSIGKGALNYCKNLTAINVTTGNTTYSSENGVLYNKDKTNLITYPGGKGDSFTIPKSVVSIDENAFSSCGLTSVIIPDSVTSIGEGVFTFNQLTSITIGANVTITRYAFNERVDNSVNSNGFVESYNNNGMQAGTYTRPETS